MPPPLSLYASFWFPCHLFFTLLFFPQVLYFSHQHFFPPSQFSAISIFPPSRFSRHLGFFAISVFPPTRFSRHFVLFILKRAGLTAAGKDFSMERPPEYNDYILHPAKSQVGSCTDICNKVSKYINLRACAPDPRHLGTDPDPRICTSD